MNETLPRRTMTMALVFALLFWGSKTITVICRMVSAPNPSVMSLPVLPPVQKWHNLVLVHHHVHHHKTKHTPVLAAIDPSSLNGIRFHSNFRSYHCIYSGHVTCNDQPCAATVKIALATANNPDVHRTFQTESDGRFSIDLKLSELPREMVDWKLSAVRGEMSDTEAHGRHILMDDDNINVDQSFNLN